MSFIIVNVATDASRLQLLLKPEFQSSRPCAVLMLPSGQLVTLAGKSPSLLLPMTPVLPTVMSQPLSWHLRRENQACALIRCIILAVVTV